MAKNTQRPRRSQGPATSGSFTFQQQTYKGPFPPASEIANYAQVNPNFPEIIFSEFQEEAKHRRLLEIKEQEHKHRLESLVNEENIKIQAKQNEFAGNNGRLQNLATKVGLWVGSAWLVLILAATIWSVYLGADYRLSIAIVAMGALPQIPKILNAYKDKNK